jgi:hypothetical protein
MFAKPRYGKNFDAAGDATVMGNVDVDYGRPSW